MKITDKMRLDYLDARNKHKNTVCRTTYGWQLTENHLRIALEDHGYPPLSVREAIDAAILASKKSSGRGK